MNPTQQERSARRSGILKTWDKLSNDELLALLESGDFTEPMDDWVNSFYILERLYKIRGPSLSQAHIKRLRDFAYATREPAEDELQENVRDHAQCYVAVLTNTPVDLVSIHQKFTAHGDLFYSPAFISAAGDLAIEDHKIIAMLTKILAVELHFRASLEVMIALGKIGPRAGEQAAKAIREARLLDKRGDDVLETRDQALKRIESSAEVWVPCPLCYHGYVNDARFSIPWIRSCVCCRGFGYLQRQA